MKRRLALVMALTLLAAPALAAKVYIDYDRDYDFNRPRTFAWNDTAETSVADENPLLHSRIVNAIEHYLTQSGLVEVSENPDVYVTYHASSSDKTSINTTNYGYGYPGGWGRYGRGYGYGGYGAAATTTTTVMTYEVGTLVVDAWDAASNKLIWRGTATDIMVSDKPSKMAKRIDSALEKIVSKSRKLKAKDEKREAGG